jgi:hypothetical protein
MARFVGKSSEMRFHDAAFLMNSVQKYGFVVELPSP